MDKTKVQAVEELLRINSQGLSITEIVEYTNSSWNTIVKILSFLDGEKKIEIRRVGTTKLHYLKNYRAKRID